MRSCSFPVPGDATVVTRKLCCCVAPNNGLRWTFVSSRLPSRWRSVSPSAQTRSSRGWPMISAGVYPRSSCLGRAAPVGHTGVPVRHGYGHGLGGVGLVRPPCVSAGRPGGAMHGAPGLSACRGTVHDRAGSSGGQDGTGLPAGRFSRVVPCRAGTCRRRAWPSRPRSAGPGPGRDPRRLRAGPLRRGRSRPAGPT